jgi:hypothetical protein
VQNIQNALRFIRTSYSLALKTTRFKKIWFYLCLGSFLLLFLWVFPLALVVELIGLQPLGMLLIGMICILIIGSLLLWGEVTAIETCRSFAALIQADKNILGPKIQIGSFVSHWVDVVVLTLALPGLKLISAVNRIFTRDAGDLPDLAAAYTLTLPVISIEGLNLAGAVARVKQILADHLLRFRSDLVAVALIARLVQWGLIISGVVLGFWATGILGAPWMAGHWRSTLGVAVGLTVGGVPLLMGMFFSSFIRSAYHTALYQWVRNVEAARKTGDNSQASAPMILRQVLVHHSSSKKEK